jgi:hypothetical protein
MAVTTVPEDVVTLSARVDWFHLQVGCASGRLRLLAGLGEFPADWADFLFLIADELERQMDAVGPVIGELRRLEEERVSGEVAP